MSEAGFPLLRLADAGRDLGLAHGRACRDLIAHNLALYFRRFAEEAELPRDEVLRRVGVYWEALTAQSPEFAAIVEGIAEGAGQALADVAALNLRYELLYTEFSRIGQADTGTLPAPAGDCTAFAVLPAAAADAHLWLGQNWDWVPGIAGVLQHITCPDGLRILSFTEAGIAGGKIGVNSAGVGLVVNGLLSNEDDWSRLGRPFHLRTWEILCSKTLDEAVGAATRGARSCSANFLIGQAGGPGQGTAVDLETAPQAVCVHDPVGGILVHANHFFDAERLGVRQPIVEQRRRGVGSPAAWLVFWTRSTYHRCGRMERLLASAPTGRLIGLEAMQTALRDHEEYPESICRHPNPALPEADRYETVASVIMDLHAGRLLAAAGPPCTNAYQEYGV
ncbi:MAG: peptidase C45 [Armatimonadetes bacterium]|nr:peptidase C45 [Armatimonadota bacterium]